MYILVLTSVNITVRCIHAFITLSELVLHALYNSTWITRVICLLTLCLKAHYS